MKAEVVLNLRAIDIISVLNERYVRRQLFLGEGSRRGGFEGRRIGNPGPLFQEGSL
jgi:hypothetical protein